MTVPVDRTDRRPWLGTALLLGVLYCAVGVIFQGPVVWRLAAWVICGAAYVVHLAHEHFRLRNSPRTAALHAAAAVGLGAFGLAVAAALHRAVSAPSGADFRLYALALVAWPVITSLPAFIVALVVFQLLSRLSRRV
jgi:hypothetical protein